jgi:hypothetical protein
MHLADAPRPSSTMGIVKDYDQRVRIGLATLVTGSFIFGMRLPAAGLEVTRFMLALLQNSGPLETTKIAISIVALAFSIVAIVTSAVVTIKLKRRDVIYERRRLFITALWDKLISVKSINTTNATAERVVELLNTLELVALCWENEIADRELIARGFGTAYCQMVDAIQGIVKGKGYDPVIAEIGTGAELLKDYDRILPARKSLDEFMKKKGI